MTPLSLERFLDSYGNRQQKITFRLAKSLASVYSLHVPSGSGWSLRVSSPVEESLDIARQRVL